MRYRVEYRTFPDLLPHLNGIESIITIVKAPSFDDAMRIVKDSLVEHNTAARDAWKPIMCTLLQGES